MPPSSSLQEVFEESVIKQALKITKDKNHILHNEYEMMPSGKRYRVPNCRFTFSLVPLSVKLLNY